MDGGDDRLSSFFVLFTAMLKESLSLDDERKDITN